MWDKITSILLKIWFYITPQDKSEYINYHILNKDEFYVKQDEFILREVIYEDRIETVKKSQRGHPITAEYVVRVPLFVCQKREGHYIRELRYKAYVGVKNYPEFERIKQEYDQLANDLHNIKSDYDLQSKELKDKIKRLDHLKQELGDNAFKNYQTKYEQIMERQRQ